MTLGLSLSAFTTLHVVISLIAIAAGLVVLSDLLRGAYRPSMVATFLATTILTSVTGLMFPSTGPITPGQIVGAISLVALLVAVLAAYGFDLRGGWRTSFVVATVLALYLNAFVAVVQSFQKFGPLARLAPTQTEAPFLIAQGVLLAGFVFAGWTAARRFAAASPAA